jgi:histidinol phosphatase-like PHP family hydrolase
MESTIPRCDFHTHTKYLRCANGTMEVPAILKECERLGVASLGITDHLNTLDKLDLHVLIREELEALDTAIDVYFGVELNFLGPDGDFAFSEEVKEETGFQFAIGGIHGTYLETYDLKAIVDIQHRHHLRTCRDPLVDVLVHPYWFNKGEYDQKGWPWFDSLECVPERYVRELGQTARETGIAILAEEGVRFSCGSDAHDIRHLSSIQKSWQVAEQLGLSRDRIWLPDCEPML